MSKHLFQIKTDILRILFHFFSLFFLDKKVVLFGAWFGQKFADNPRAMFEFLAKNENIYHLNCFWMVKNKDLYKTLRKIPFLRAKVLYSRSLKGFFFQLHAKALVCCISPENDFIPFLFGRKIILNFSHGIGTKKPEDDNSEFDKREWAVVLKRQKLYSEFNRLYYCVPSEHLIPFFKDFNKRGGTFVVLGCPRLDSFVTGVKPSLAQLGVSNAKMSSSYSHVILYMPTHRSEGKAPFHVESVMDLKAINELCKSTNSLFIIKKHFYHKGENEPDSLFSNIIDVTNFSVDVQLLLRCGDIMISDYSSVLFDFVVLDRPAIFFAFDLQQYLAKERGLYLPYEKTAYGPIVQDKKTLCVELKKILNGDDEYSTKRAEIKNFFYSPSITYPCAGDCVSFLKKEIEAKKRHHRKSN